MLLLSQGEPYALACYIICKGGKGATCLLLADYSLEGAIALEATYHFVGIRDGHKGLRIFP